ncbi:MAG: GPR endopeptidase [Clostridia bacterium]|nr:GPR endopeptidase [Clostridia bacterium]
MTGIYTDLAAEARELHPELPGIYEQNEQCGKIALSRIKVENEDSAKKIGKLCGRYITLDSPDLASRESDSFHEMAMCLATELKSLLGDLKENATVLVAGLGNRYITPDSLGPKIAEKVFVTRHITEYMPEALQTPLRAVCAVAPGVLGITGVETYDVISGLVEKLKPDAVIVTDALASRRAARISTTVQLTDTGISPGSGVGNTRMGLNSQTLGVPVIALGVPMVVFASTIAQDTISLIADKTGLHNDEQKLIELADEVISEHMGPMVVTPKDIDCIVEDMAKVLSEGINRALHGEHYDDVEDILA